MLPTSEHEEVTRVGNMRCHALAEAIDKVASLVGERHKRPLLAQLVTCCKQSASTNDSS